MGNNYLDVLNFFIVKVRVFNKNSMIIFFNSGCIYTRNNCMAPEASDYNFVKYIQP